jgi:DNA cross-link repair 1B protein
MFPKITNIFELDLNIKHTITLNAEQKLTVDVYLFDANHIPGSVLLLFQGYMGTILFTGDMRFRKEMIEENPILYPPELVEKQRAKGYEKCSIHVDEVIFDNTYCDPIFNFPTRDIAAKQMIAIIDKNRGKRVIIAMGALGKEAMLVTLSENYQTLILISDTKFKQIEAMGMRTDIFTTNPKDSWIELVSKKHRLRRLEEENKTGNKDFILVSIDFLMFEGDLNAPDGISFLVPYSQHSNFSELELFVRSICPSILRKLVLPYLQFNHIKNRPIDNIAAYLGYVKNLQRGGKSAFRIFLDKHTSFMKLSPEYKKWMVPDVQKQLMLDLGFIKNSDPTLRKKRKRDLLIEELEKFFPGKTWQEIDKKVFHASHDKKGSLHDISLQMMAVNNNQSMDTFAVPKGKKLKLTPKKPQKRMPLKKSASMGFDNLDYLQAVLKSKRTEGEDDTELTKDGELLSLMETFMMSDQ